jgi:6-pyruvoyl-tetrahydropterin synthase
MLADFGDLKTFMTYGVHDVLDHGFIVYGEDTTMLKALGASQMPYEFALTRVTFTDDWKVIVTDFIPTAENLARWCWFQLKGRVEEIGFKMDLVELWETPTSLATYRED